MARAPGIGRAQPAAPAADGRTVRRLAPRNGLAAAWLRERKRRAARRARGRAGPLGLWRHVFTLIAFAGALAGLSVWLGGFVETSVPAVGALYRSTLADAGFTVAHIEVRGARRAEAAEVAAALGLRPGALIFDFDPHSARERVERLAWVESAHVLRLLPDRVVVLVDERRPLAVWGSSEGVVVIDAAGAAIEGVDPAAFGDLPRLDGAAAPTAAGELVEALARHPELARRARVFERIGGRRWNVRLQSGLVVQLPEGDVAAALAELEALETHEGVLDLPLETLDLRGEDLVLRPRELSAAGFERGA